MFKYWSDLWKLVLAFKSSNDQNEFWNSGKYEIDIFENFELFQISIFSDFPNIFQEIFVGWTSNFFCCQGTLKELLYVM